MSTIRELIRASIKDIPLDEGTPRYTGFTWRTRTLYFRYKDYVQQVRLADFGVVSRLRGSDEDKLDAILTGDVEVTCSCPSYLYHGFMFIGTQLDYSLTREMRPPNVTNPGRDGTVCKHLHYILENFRRYRPNILRDLERSRKANYRSTRYLSEARRLITKRSFDEV